MNIAQNMFVNYRVINNAAYIASRGEAYKLEETEKFIWEQIGSGNTLDNVIQAVKEKYNVFNSGVDEDVKEFVMSLIENRLVENI